MASRQLYIRFTSLCRKWPTDEGMTGRDYAEKFRSQLGAHFPHGELSQIKDIEKVEESLEALERLVNNKYCNENILRSSTATGLNSNECKVAISNRGLEEIQEIDENSVIERLKEKLSVKFVPRSSIEKDEIDGK